MSSNVDSGLRYAGVSAVITLAPSRHQACPRVCTVVTRAPSRQQVCRRVCTVLTRAPSRHINRYADASAQYSLEPVMSRQQVRMSVCTVLTKAPSCQQVRQLSEQSLLRPRRVTSTVMPVCLQSSLRPRKVNRYAYLSTQSSLRPRQVASTIMPICLHSLHSGPETTPARLRLQVGNGNSIASTDAPSQQTNHSPCHAEGHRKE